MELSEHKIKELIERAVIETNQILRHPPEPCLPEQVHVVDKLPPGMKRRDPIRWREDGSIFIHESLVEQIVSSSREKGGSKEDIEKAVINLLKSIIARFYYIVRLGYNEWNRLKTDSHANINELSRIRDALNDLAESLNVTFHDHHLAVIDQTLKNNLYMIISQNLAILAAKYGTDRARQLYKHVPRILNMTLPYTWPSKEEIDNFIKNKNIPYIVRTRKIVSLQRLLDMSKQTIFPEAPHEYELVNDYRFIYVPEGLISDNETVYPPSTKVSDNIYEIQKLKATAPQIKKLRLTIGKFNTLIDANFAGLELMFTNTETLTPRITETIVEHLEMMVDLYGLIASEGDRHDGEEVSRAFESMKSDLQEKMSLYGPHDPLPEDIRARITHLKAPQTLSDVTTVHEMYNYVHVQSFSALDSAATHLGKDYFFLLKDKLKVIDANERPWIDSYGTVVNPLMRSVLLWAEDETEGRIVLVENCMWAHIRMGDHSAVVHAHPFPPDEGGMLAIAYAEGEGYFMKGRAFRVALLKDILESLHMRVTIRGSDEFIQAALDKDSGIKTSHDIFSAFHTSMSALNSTRNIDITINEIPLDLEAQQELAHKWARIFLAENDFPFKVPNKLASLFVDSEYSPGYISEEPSYTKYLEYKEKREKQWPRLRQVINNELKRLNLPLIGDRYGIVGQKVIDTFFNDPIKLGLERGEFIMVHNQAERTSDYMSRRHIFQLLSLEPARVLFVCTGNTCRSHMAEHMMKYYLKASGEDNIHVWSRGILVQKIRVRTAVYKCLSTLDIPAPDKRHIPKQIALDDIRDADIIFVMAEGHKEYILQLAPESEPKIYLLTEFSAPDKETENIIDPSGKSDEFYEKTAHSLKSHVEKIVSRFKEMDIESLKTGTMVRQLEGHIQFETTGGMGRYLVQRASLAVEDEMLDVYALRDSDTDSIHYGRVYAIKELEDRYQRTRLDPLSLSRILEKSYFAVGPPLEITEVQRRIARKKLYAEPQESIWGEQIKGLGASQGREGTVSGIVTYKRGHKQEEKKIFITPFTTPDDIEAIKESCAVVTTGGGILSHAGITTREFGIPSVIVHRAEWAGKGENQNIVLQSTTPQNYSKTPSGIWMSSSVKNREIHIKEGDLLTVDGFSGSIIPYEPGIQSEIKKAFLLLENLHSDSPSEAYSELHTFLKNTSHFDVVPFIVNHVLSDKNALHQHTVKPLFETVSSNHRIADSWADYQKRFSNLHVEQAWTLMNTVTESIASSFSISQVKAFAEAAKEKIKSIQELLNTFTLPLKSLPDISCIDELDKEKAEQLKDRSLREINNILSRKQILTPHDMPEIGYVFKAGKDNGVFSEDLENLIQRLKAMKGQKEEKDLEKQNIIPLNQLDENSIALAGGKSARVGILLNAREYLLSRLSSHLKEAGCDFSVPQGFVITTRAFRDFFHKKGVVAQIDSINLSPELSPKEKSRAIQQLICDYKITGDDEFGQAILRAFDKSTADVQNPWVAVRSSSILEDTYEAAYAGMGKTDLFIDKQRLLDKICDVKASAWTERAIIYSEEKKVNLLEIRQAVLVQEMINPEVSGVIFTQEPVTYNNSQVVINASYGLGEAIVSGLVLPDQYVTDKESGEEVSQLFIGSKRIKIVRNHKGYGTKTEYVDRKERRGRALSLNQTKILTHIARAIEEFFHFSVDIEFAIEGSTIWIVQVRPVTTGVRA